MPPKLEKFATFCNWLTQINILSKFTEQQDNHKVTGYLENMILLSAVLTFSRRIEPYCFPLKLRWSDAMLALPLINSTDGQSNLTKRPHQ